MKIFLSWSGERAKAMAKVMREWLPTLFPSVEPWMSEEDVAKGRRWSAEIAATLGECKVGVVCVTTENVTSAWLNFEAGAISKTVTDAYVCPLLLDLRPSDLTGRDPLSQFQATTIEKSDVRRLVDTVNQALAGNKEPSFAAGAFDKAFERAWPDLEKALKLIPAATGKRPGPERSERDILEEVLSTVRDIARAQAHDRQLAEMVAAATNYQRAFRPILSFQEPSSLTGLLPTTLSDEDRVRAIETLQVIQKRAEEGAGLRRTKPGGKGGGESGGGGKKG